MDRRADMIAAPDAWKDPVPGVWRPNAGKAVKLRGAASASPALPAVQHLTELAGADRRSRAGDRDLVGVGRCVCTEPIRLAVLTPAARLGSPFAGDVFAGEIAGRKC